MKKYTYTKNRQIHLSAAIKKVCHATPANSRQCGTFKALWLRYVCGYDGCGHCNPTWSKHNG